MSTLFSASFTAANDTALADYTPDVGSPGVAVTGAFTIESNLVLPPASTADAIFLWDVGESNTIITATLFIPGDGSYAQGLVFERSMRITIGSAEFRGTAAESRICLLGMF
jgi:hypothetical protein